MTEQDKQLLKFPMKDSTVQENWEETLPHQKASVLLSLVVCPTLPSRFIAKGWSQLLPWFCRGGLM